MRSPGFKHALMMAAVICSPQPAAADLGWVVYRDSTHGCRVDFPSALFSADALAPDRPQRFSGANQDVYFRIMGVENNPAWTPSDIRRKYLNLNMPGAVVYQRTKDNFVVLAGYRERNSFYTKVAVSDDRRTACILDVNYPLLHTKNFDGIVMRMARSFAIAQRDVQ